MGVASVVRSSPVIALLLVVAIAAGAALLMLLLSVSEAPPNRPLAKISDGCSQSHPSPVGSGTQSSAWVTEVVPSV